MQRELTKRLHRDYIKVNKMNMLIINGIFLALIIAYFVVASFQEWTLWPGWIALALFVVSLVVLTWIVPELEYKRFRYELFEEELELKSGLIFIKNVLVPMVRVQHVELGSGPLMRKFDLASVLIVTAATTHRIGGLKLTEAEKLKLRIGELARVEDQDE